MCKFKKVQLSKLCTCILKYDLRRTTDKKCRVDVGLNHLLLKITCLKKHQKKKSSSNSCFNNNTSVLKILRHVKRGNGC